eukprot:4965138-Pyramimonas_sp.AAC.1
MMNRSRYRRTGGSQICECLWMLGLDARDGPSGAGEACRGAHESRGNADDIKVHTSVKEHSDLNVICVTSRPVRTSAHLACTRRPVPCKSVSHGHTVTWARAICHDAMPDLPTHLHTRIRQRTELSDVLIEEPARRRPRFRF